MKDDEKMLWDLFCSTGEPRYYSMYAELKRRNAANENKR